MNLQITKENLQEIIGSVSKLTNHLVVYKGGCYSGCFWERNWFTVINGEFKQGYSSGAYGIKSIEKLSTDNNELDIYDIGSQDDMLELGLDFEVSVCKYIQESTEAKPLFECFGCGEILSVYDAINIGFNKLKNKPEFLCERCFIDDNLDEAKEDAEEIFEKYSEAIKELNIDTSSMVEDYHYIEYSDNNNHASLYADRQAIERALIEEIKEKSPVFHFGG